MFSESAYSAAETLFKGESGFADTRHKLNLNTRPVPAELLRELEGGCAIETLDKLGAKYPICKYETQITIHGVFPRLEVSRIGGYKNIFQNKNKSIGVKWNAIDRAKKKRLFYILSRTCGWSVVDNSTTYSLQRVKSASSREDAQGIIDDFTAEAERLNAANGLWTGTAFVRGINFWGKYYIVLRVNLLTFRKSDFSAVASLFAGMEYTALLDKYTAYLQERKAENEQREKEEIERARQYAQAKAEAAKRKAEFIASNPPPFKCEPVQEFAPQVGDIMAICTNSSKWDISSPYMWKYYTFKKAFGRLVKYECDENGKTKERKGYALRRGELVKGRRKIG